MAPTAARPRGSARPAAPHTSRSLLAAEPQLPSCLRHPRERAGQRTPKPGEQPRGSGGSTYVPCDSGSKGGCWAPYTCWMLVRKKGNKLAPHPFPRAHADHTPRSPRAWAESAPAATGRPPATPGSPGPPQKGWKAHGGSHLTNEGALGPPCHRPGHRGRCPSAPPQAPTSDRAAGSRPRPHTGDAPGSLCSRTARHRQGSEQTLKCRTANSRPAPFCLKDGGQNYRKKIAMMF